LPADTKSRAAYQNFIFGAGLLEDRDIGIGVFPEGEKPN
jgi:hypothetical protein